MLLTIAPWTIRNYVTFDRFFLVSSNGGWVLWLGNNPGADGRVMDWTTALKEAEGAAFVDLNRRLGREATTWIFNNPVKFLKLIPVKQAHTWGTEAASLPRGLDRRGYTLEQIIRATTQLFYVALALAAAYALVRYSGVLVRSPEMLMACYLLALVWVIHSIFVGWSFYHKPFLPLLTAIAVGCYKRS
jgi:hypothetical protein